MKKHIEDNHSSPDLPSLGDYLVSLENKINRCNEIITKQSVTAVRQSAMIEKLLKPYKGKTHESVATVTSSLKCDKCNFETVDKNLLNVHKNKSHA